MGAISLCSVEPGYENTHILLSGLPLLFYFASVFTGKCCSHTAQDAEDNGRDWENEEPPAVGEDQV